MTDLINPKYLSAADRAAKQRAAQRATNRRLSEMHRGILRNLFGSKAQPVRAYAGGDAGTSRMRQIETRQR